MPASAYYIPSTIQLLQHGGAVQPFVNDTAPDGDDLSKMLIEARLRSGDYFITLATELDKLAQLLQDENSPEAAALEQISTEIAYLDKHYRLQPK